MKKYISSYRMFSAVRLWRHIALPLILSAVGFVVSWIMPALLEKIGAEEDFFGGMFAGLFAGMAIMSPVVTVIVMSTIAGAANPAVQGYKYFHSIPDCAAHFKRAMITSAVMSSCVVLVWSGMAFVFLTVLGWSELWAICLFGWAILGLAEITVFIRQAVVRIAVFFPFFFLTGIFTGFFTAVSEDGEEIPAAVSVVLLVLTIALVIAGNVNIILNSERKWYPKAKEC